jgi:hypothetical protein
VLGVCGVADLTVGSVTGAVKAPGDKENRPSEETLSSTLGVKTIQKTLRYQAESSAANYYAAGHRQIATILKKEHLFIP